MNDSIESLTGLISKKPGDVGLYLRRAELYKKAGQYESALIDYNRAIELDGQNSDAYNNRGNVYSDLKEYDKALADYNRAIELDDKCDSAYSNRGNIHRILENYDKALSDYNRAIKLNNKFHYAYNGRGILYKNIGDYDSALADYNRAIELNNKLDKAYFNRGLLYFTLKNYGGALSDYSRAIELNDKYDAAYNNRGFLYKDLGDYGRALADYDRAIELGSGAAKSNRAWLIKQEPDFSIDHYTRAIERNPGDGGAYYKRGNIYLDRERLNIGGAREDYERAERDFTAAIGISGKADYYMARAEARRLLSRYEEALEDYKKAGELYRGEKDSSGERYSETRARELGGILIGLQLGEKAKKTEAPEAPDAASGKDGMSEADEILAQIISKTMGMEDDTENAKRDFVDFLSAGGSETPEGSEASEPFVFEVLRRWNSYTPIIADDSRASRGGGYFVRAGGCGIVIDPGFNFIDNFKAAGHKFWEIDHVLVSHSHNDHTADLESLLTLLYKYNDNILGEFDRPADGTIMYKVQNSERIPGEPESEDDRESYKKTPEYRKKIEARAKEMLEKSPRRKRLHLHMTAGTYKKYVTMLDLYAKSDYDLSIIKAGETLNPQDVPNPQWRPLPRDMTVRAIKTKHSDMMSDRDGVGFEISYKDFFLVYTGDTGFDEDIGRAYAEVKKNAEAKDIILLAHLGGFKPYESAFAEAKTQEERSKTFYKNHLGRLGLGRLVQILKPKICLISEFGEEFKNSRVALTEVFSKNFEGTTFFAADIGFALDAGGKVRAMTSADDLEKKEFIDARDVRTWQRDVDYSLHYYSKDVKESKLAVAMNNKYIAENLPLLMPYLKSK